MPPPFRFKTSARAVVWLLAFLPALGLAAETDTEQNVIDELHATVSDGFSDIIGGVDDFFATAEAQKQVNRSWMRLRIDASKFESDSVEGRLNAKLKLILPNTEQRVRLLVSTDEEDNRDNRGGGLNEQALAESTEDTNLSLALRFLKSVKNRNSLKFDIGARVRDSKAQAFGRISASHRKSLGPRLDLNVSNNLWYFSSSGYDNRLRLNVERSFADSPDLLASTTTQFTWLEGSRGAVIDQTFGLYRALDAQTFLALELLASYRTAHSYIGQRRLRGTALRLRYRKNVWRPWFYYELRPQMRWNANDDYIGRFGLLARVEVEIGRRSRK